MTGERGTTAAGSGHEVPPRPDLHGLCGGTGVTAFPRPPHAAGRPTTRWGTGRTDLAMPHPSRKPEVPVADHPVVGSHPFNTRPD
ncbi:hypothetical protein [Actinoalloteichus caeruleus]|uniref:hypothetical protein n=1 Tax=Actinoalloteichus cyanogriseus TaxID=2893586 RepID=UPI003AAE4ACF